METIKKDIEIRKLTPELAEDYACFFDRTPHSERPDDEDCKCYCVWWCQADQDVDHIEYLLSPQLRRSYAIEHIKSNSIQGYLAYSGDQVVGWCNANTKADCQKCFCWRRFMSETPTVERTSDMRVKSIFCFLVAPEYRRKGIAKLLLERVCEDAARDGFDFAEAYPKKVFVNEAVDFMGAAELFKKSGFTVHAEISAQFVMRKQLKGESSAENRE